MNSPDSSFLSKLEKLISPLIKRAGKYSLDNWQTIKSANLKDKRDLVTNIDVEIENMLRIDLTTLFPEAGFIVEEGETLKKEEYNWVIDPIDGTKNYATFYPAFFVQISLLYRMKPVLGLVFNPVSDQLFTTSFKNGARLNGKLIKSNLSRTAESAIIDVDFGGNDSIVDWKLNFLNKLIKTVYRVRITGGFGNAYLLTGAFDGCICFDQQKRDKYIVDNAPRVILMEEAGFKTENMEISEGKNIFLAANPKLLVQLKNCLK